MTRDLAMTLIIRAINASGRISAEQKNPREMVVNLGNGAFVTVTVGMVKR